MKVLLEHKKRKPRVPEHPDYEIQKTSGHRASFVRYDAYHRGTGKHVGQISGTYDRGHRHFNVNFAGATGRSVDDETTSLRKQGKHDLPQNLIHHVLKHIRKDHPGALRMTADRISGVRPNHDVDVPLRRPSAKELTPKEGVKHYPGGISVVQHKGRKHHFSVSKTDKNAVWSNDHKSDFSWRNIRQAARLAQKTFPDARNMHVATPDWRVRSIPLKKAKTNTPYVEPFKAHDHTVINIKHPRKGQLTSFNLKASSPGRTTIGRLSNSNTIRDDRTKQRIKSMTFGQKRRIYRIVKDKIAAKENFTKLSRMKISGRIKYINVRSKP